MRVLVAGREACGASIAGAAASTAPQDDVAPRGDMASVVAVTNGTLALLSGFRLSPIFPIGLKPLIDTIGPKEPWDTRPPVYARQTEWLRRG